MIPVYKPFLGEREDVNLQAAWKSGWISSKGEFITEFENRFANYIGRKHALTITSGSTGCHLAVQCAGIKPGDKVIVPNTTYIATANAIRYCNAEPILVDVNPSTWNMSLSLMEKAYLENPDAVAVFAVPLLGNPCNKVRLEEMCEHYGLTLIEDACESLGSKHSDGTMTGTLGLSSVFSFFGNKTITTGEGGMLVTDDDDVAAQAALLRGQGQYHQYYHTVVGYNYRMTNLQAAIGLGQMESLDTILQLKENIRKRYRQNLQACDDIQWQEIDDEGGHHFPWMIAMKFNDKHVARRIRDLLRQDNIDTRPLFSPINSMPPYKDSPMYAACCNTYSNHLAETVVMFPSYPELKMHEIDNICSLILRYVR